MESTRIRDSAETGHNAAAIDLPADRDILREVRECLSGRNVGISRIADLISQDVVVTLELIGTANNRRQSEAVSAIESIRTGIFRLGSETLIALLDSIAARPDYTDPEVHSEFNKLRLLAWRMSVVGKLLANNVNRGLAEDAQLTGLFTPVGLMIACAKFQERYVALARKLNKASVIYRLSQDLKFDVYGVQLHYLETRGIPTSLTYVFDREFQCKTPIEAALRFLTNAAAELVDAYDSGKWDKYAPNLDLPGKSALRFLRLSENQHTNVFEECSEFLKSVGNASTPGEVLRTLPGKKTEEVAAPPLAIEEETVHPEERAIEDFVPPIEYIETGKDDPQELPEHFSQSSHDIVDIVGRVIADAKTAEELLKKFLGLLIANGPYVRVALLVVRSNRRSALVHVALGRGLEDGSDIEVHDPLSPIAMCATKIRSFNSQEAVDLTAPFGVSAYALSPLKIANYAPVLLYADCGGEQALPFEARRIFRLVVGLLNATLPRLPGGLPEREEVLLGLDGAA